MCGVILNSSGNTCRRIIPLYSGIFVNIHYQKQYIELPEENKKKY